MKYSTNPNVKSTSQKDKIQLLTQNEKYKGMDGRKRDEIETNKQNKQSKQQIDVIFKLII